MAPAVEDLPLCVVQEVELDPVQHGGPELMLQMEFLLIFLLEPHPPSVLPLANRFSPAAHVADPVGVHREHLVLSPLGSVLLNGSHVELEDLFVDLVDFVDHVGFFGEIFGELGVGRIPEAAELGRVHEGGDGEGVRDSVIALFGVFLQS